MDLEMSQMAGMKEGLLKEEERNHLKEDVKSPRIEGEEIRRTEGGGKRRIVGRTDIETIEKERLKEEDPRHQKSVEIDRGVVTGTDANHRRGKDRKLQEESRQKDATRNAGLLPSHLKETDEFPQCQSIAKVIPSFAILLRQNKSLENHLHPVDRHRHLRAKCTSTILMMIGAS